MMAAVDLPETMQAWLCPRYGGPEVLVLGERLVPRPGPNDVLVRVRAATVSSGDVRVRALRLPPGFGPLGRLIFGFRRPRQPVLGSDFAGIVAAVGDRVTAFRPGEAVLGAAGAAMGGHGEYICLAQDKALAHLPAELSFAEGASLVFGGTAAMHFLRRGALQAGEALLVIGAAGAVGSAMVQLAVHKGARITAVTGPDNLAFARELGAAEAIDYRQSDVTAGAARYDVVADTVGAGSFAHYRPILNEHGRFLAVSGGLADMLARRKGTQRPIAGPAAERADDLAHLVELAQQGRFRPIIDSTYPFAELPAAHARVDTGHKRGNVVVTVDEAGPAAS